MPRTICCVTLLWILSWFITSQAASFDCLKATTKIEKLICSDPELSKLDEILSRTYKTAIAASTSKHTVKLWQQTWLFSVREPCNNIECLKEAYLSQIDEMNEYTEANSAGSVFTGSYERYYHGKPDKHSATIDVLELKNMRVRIIGDAIWVGNPDTGNVNTGEINGLSQIVGNKVHFQDPISDTCILDITFAENALAVVDEKMECGGLNVTFEGQYRKIIHEK
jgi:uncharacterized protein